MPWVGEGGTQLRGICNVGLESPAWAGWAETHLPGCFHGNITVYLEWKASGVRAKSGSLHVFTRQARGGEEGVGNFYFIFP